MPSIFDAADAKSSAAISSVFGIKLRLIPMKTGKGILAAPGPDPDREPVDFQGIIAGALGDQNISGDRNGKFAGTVSTRDRAMSVNAPDWPAHAREGDRIQAIEEAGQPLYDIVSEPRLDGMNRIVANLVVTK